MALNTCELWSNGIKIFFKNRPAAVFLKSPPGRSPSLPSVIRLSYTSLLNTSPIYTFTLITWGLSPFLKTKANTQITASDIPIYNIFYPIAYAGFWKGGGAILKEWEVCKRPWLEFSLILNQFQTVCPKLEAKCLGKLGNSKLFSAQN